MSYVDGRVACACPEGWPKRYAVVCLPLPEGDDGSSRHLKLSGVIFDTPPDNAHPDWKDLILTFDKIQLRHTGACPLHDEVVTV